MTNGTKSTYFALVFYGRKFKSQILQLIPNINKIIIKLSAQRD